MTRGIDSRWILAPVAVVLGAALIVLGHHSVNRSPNGQVLQSGDSAFDPIRADEIQTILPEDAIPALVSPSYLSASAARDIRDGEEVIGLAVNGDVRAFPIATLSAHEIVDDVIGGHPVAVTW
jgi:Protein of unknown function (DUF3179)